MKVTYNNTLLPFSRSLRSNMTKAEILLWSKLRRKQLYGVQFFRQKPIGPYIVDFYAKMPRLVIELDGGHHFEPEQMKNDIVRDHFLQSQGFTVLRFDNRSIMENCRGVLEMIAETIERHPSRALRGPLC